jgi:hypothetical protein
MQEDGVQNGQHEYIQEIVEEKTQDFKYGKPGRAKKIPLKNPSEHNHSN